MAVFGGTSPVPVDMWKVGGDPVENVPLPVPFPEAPERPGPEVLPASMRKKRARPTYRRIKRRFVTPHTCDDCLLVSHEKYPNDPVPLKAKWERRIVGEGARFLCGPHAEQWHKRDGSPGAPLQERE